MSIEKSKAPLALMEQIIMILVFALAAAVCLQAFVYSDRLSDNGARTEMAATKAQTVAETIKSCHGDREKVSALLKSTETSDGFCVTFEEEKMMVLVTLTEETEYMQKATVDVQETDGTSIYKTDIAWQKGGQL